MTATASIDQNPILHYEILIRIGCFAGILILLMVLEYLRPRRVEQQPKSWRWFSNLGIVVLNTVALRVAFPLMAIDAAFLAERNSWGLFHTYDLPSWLTLILSVIILDFAIYLQHVMFHAVPLFWRFHRMHHADLDIDVTTGVRFHPFEILLSMGIKIGVVILIGASALSVLIFEVLLNASSLFSHANWKLPLGADKILRLLIVTPDMHRVHHSILPRETNSNFGFNLSLWDRLLGTYQAQPSAGHQGMTIGIEQFREKKYLKLFWMILIPFIGAPSNYPLNKR